jgi:membrane protein YqaA with SNARE-associated domain
MEALFTPQAGLIGLFLASLLAATLLPGGSEAVLFAVVKLHPEQAMAALAVATLGNTLGGMSTYGLARLLPDRLIDRLSERRMALAQRWGSLSLVLAWLPIIGDALCAAAGALRLPWLPSTLWMAFGKGLRYAVVLAGASL